MKEKNPLSSISPYSSKEIKRMSDTLIYNLSEHHTEPSDPASPIGRLDGPFTQIFGF